MQATRAIVIGNPTARSVTAALMDELHAVLADLELEVTTRWTTGRGDARRLSQSAVESLEPGTSATIVALGGDGTVCEVADGLVRGLGSAPSRNGRRLDVGLSIVPAGSGNSAFSAIWPEQGWADALCGSQAAGVPARRLDLLRICETGSVTMLGANFGLGARVAQLLSGVRDVDTQRRWIAIREALEEGAVFSGRVTVDHRTLYEGRISQVAVGGVRRFLGGHFEFLPHAELDDGCLDVCVVEALDDEQSLVELASLVPAGQHVGHPRVHYAKAQRARVERTDGGRLLFEHDGDAQRFAAGGDAQGPAPRPPRRHSPDDRGRRLTSADRQRIIR